MSMKRVHLPPSTAAGSPLVRHARLKGIFISCNEEWLKYGVSAWDEMMSLLNHLPPARRVLAIDAEWFMSNPLAVVQFATCTHCLVIHLSYMNQRQIPWQIRAALENPDIIKCGVGVRGDASRIEIEQNTVVRTSMDLDAFAVYYGLGNVGATNLAALTKDVAGVEMMKEKKITRSNWDRVLTLPQVHYAADDAVASFLIGDKIMQAAIEDQGCDSFDVATWLSHNSDIAASTLKRGIRERHKEQNARRKAQKESEKQSQQQPQQQLQVPLTKQSAVKVYSITGKYLFECSKNRAYYYTDERGIACVLSCRRNHSPAEIQFLFDHSAKTRLCQYNVYGFCDMGENCPFAHGVEELTLSARLLAFSPMTEVCSVCLGAVKLRPHPLVPKIYHASFPPYLHSRLSSSTLPVCAQCITLVQLHTKEEMNYLYEYTQKSIHRSSPNALSRSKIKDCIRTAGLLLSSERAGKIPPGRQVELKKILRENWRSAFLPGSDVLSQVSLNDIVSPTVQLDPALLKTIHTTSVDDVCAHRVLWTLVELDMNKGCASVSEEQAYLNFVQFWESLAFQKFGLIHSGGVSGGSTSSTDKQ